VHRRRLDHIYSTWYFWALNVLLAASLTACSYTTQWPQLTVARDWRWAASPAAIARMAVHEALPRACATDLARSLAAQGYQVFATPSGKVYGFKGLIGKMAPIAVHAALLLSMAGFLTSALGGATGSAMAPEGSAFVIADALKKASPLTVFPRAASLRIAVDDFRVTYYPSGAVSQFYSDLSVLAPDGTKLASQEMKVNVPLRYKGITAYQTDWAIAAATVRVGEPPGAGAAAAASAAGGDAAAAAEAALAAPLALPMASLEGASGFNGRIWGTFIPLPGPPPAPGARPRGVTMVARDFQSAAFYDSSGVFVGVRRPGSGKPITVDGVPIVLEGLTGATGLELKSDPGVRVGASKQACACACACAHVHNCERVQQLRRRAAVSVCAGAACVCWLCGRHADVIPLLRVALASAAPAPCSLDARARALTAPLHPLPSTQVWALQEGTTLHVGGKTTKQKARGRQRSTAHAHTRAHAHPDAL
jgi:cytochrome c biogenesis protein